MIKKSPYTEAEQAQLQKRLSYILKKFRSKMGISSKEMAFHIGYSPSKYSKIESGNIVYDRFINSLELLKIFASLEGMTLSEFVTFLEGKKTSSEESFLSKWEEKAISSLRRLNMNLRREFINSLGSISKKEKDLLESCLGLFIKIQNKKVEETTLNAFITLIDKVRK